MSLTITTRGERRRVVGRLQRGGQGEAHRPILARRHQALDAEAQGGHIAALGDVHAFRVKAAAPPSRSASAASVERLRVPFGRPGLPGAKGQPRVDAAPFRGSVMRAHDAAAPRRLAALAWRRGRPSARR